MKKEEEQERKKGRFSAKLPTRVGGCPVRLYRTSYHRSHRSRSSSVPARSLFCPNQRVLGTTKRFLPYKRLQWIALYQAAHAMAIARPKRLTNLNGALSNPAHGGKHQIRRQLGDGRPRELS